MKTSQFYIFQLILIHFLVESNSDTNTTINAIELINKFNVNFGEIKANIINRICPINTIIPRTPEIIESPGFVIDSNKVKFTFHPKGISDQKRIKSHKSNMEFLHSTSASLENHNELQQQLQSAPITNTLSTTKTVTTTDAIHYDHEISIGGNVYGELNLLIVRFGGGVSPSYGHNWGTSQSNTISQTITNQTSYTVPSQLIIVNPMSRVDVFVDFFSYVETVYYLIDLEIDDSVDLSYYNSSDIKCAGLSMGNRFNLRYLLDFVDPLHRTDDAVVIVQINGQLILKNIPFVTKITGHHTQVRTGKQIPLY